MIGKIIGFLKEWALIVSIVAGILGYLIYDSIRLPGFVHEYAMSTVALVQPALIFLMLFLTFCKVDPRHLRLCRWHLWLLLIQGGAFSLIAIILIMLPHSGLRVVLEGAMICLICPTATAAAVITRKLGGNMSHLTTYTILINTLCAVLIPALLPYVHPAPGMSVLIPALLPYVHPAPGMSVLNASMLIMGKVFPLLLFPLFLAMIVRRAWPGMLRAIDRYPDAAFYIWIVSLALAMAVTTRSLRHSSVDLATEMWLVAVSLVSCILQFWIGKRIGARYNDTIACGQALGQKNTVLAIWMGYTFFTPVTSIAGGFYSVWHNVVNSWQLHRMHKETQQQQRNPTTHI